MTKRLTALTIVGCAGIALICYGAFRSHGALLALGALTFAAGEAMLIRIGWFKG